MMKKTLNPGSAAGYCRMLMAGLVMTLLASPTTAQVTSGLWGVNGELWTTNSLLGDFTSVGYMSGDVPIPDWPVGVNVTNFGAVADDDIDDSQAFLDAIAACPSNHAVFVPNGTYNIEQQIAVTNRSNFVLRGEDMYDTVLWFPYYLTEIPNTPDTAFFYFRYASRCSIENFSLIFREQKKGGHWEFLGADAIHYHGVNQSWIRNLYIKNSDHAIGISSMFSKNISVLNIILDQYLGRTDMEGDSRVGHMGITVFDAAYHLIDNVKITGNWHHDVNAQGGTKCVWSRITGSNVRLDHHAQGVTGNLWTDIDFGRGEAWFGGIKETYWNVRGDVDKPYPDPADRNVFVGCQTADPTDLGTNYWHESIVPESLVPTNIYFAQLEKAGKPVPVAIDLPLPEPEWPLRLLAVDDAQIEGGSNSNKNYGYNGSITLKNGSGTTDRKGYFKYDLSVAGVTNVVCAKLRMYFKSVTGSFGLQIEEVSDDSWSEATITYSTQPPVGSVITTTNLHQGWVEVDLTDYVNSELAVDQKVSFRLRGGGPGHSKDAQATVMSEEGGNSAELVLYQDAAKVGPPAAPTGLTAVPGSGVVTLDWSDNTDSDFAIYNLYRSTPDNSSYVLQAGGLIYSHFQDIKVTNDETYYYLVKAVDTGGIESPQGSEGFAIPASPTNNPPAFTTHLIVEADALEGTVYSATIADDASDPESDPMIFSLVSGPAWLGVGTDGSLSGTPDLGDEGTNTFTVQVTAAGGSDTATLKITVNVDPLAPPAAPTGLSATAGNNLVALDWADNGEGDLAGYSVYRSTTSGSYGSALAANLTSSDYVDSTALNGLTYYYVVTAFDTNNNESAQSSEASATAGDILFGTFFTGGRTRNETDWSNGFPSSTNQGAISAGGIVDGNSGFYVTQNDFTMNNPYGSCGFGNGEWTLNGGQLSANALSTSGHLLTINGGTFKSTTAGGDITIGSSAASTLNVNSGTVSTLDAFTVKNGSAANISGGTVSVGNSLSIQDGSVFTVYGGTLTVTSSLGASLFYTGTVGTMSFNGGTVTAGALSASTKPASPITFVFGGTSVGSVTVSGLGGGAGNRSIDWLPGTKVTLAVTNVDEWAETEWNAGRLTYNGDDYTVLGSWAAVTAEDGLENGVRFDYDSDTETLSLVSGIILSGYDQWASGWSTNIGAATNDFDLDGLDNLYEYGTDGNPTNGLDRGTLPTLTNAGSALLYIHPQRSDDVSLIYTVETTTNLVDGPWTNDGYTVTGTYVTGGTLDFVTNDVDTAEDERFIRLKIGQ